MPAQSVILPLPSVHARFLVIKTQQLEVARIKAQLQHFLDTRDRLLTQHTHQNIKVAIAFGPELWARLHNKMPPNFCPLQEITGAAFDMPVVPADIFIHIASERADICFILAQAALQGIRNDVKVVDEITSFRYIDNRDLTGFIDGTENPQMADDRAEVALLPEESGEFCEGSFIFAQRFVHDLDKWNKLRTTAQEDVFGRTKLDSVELPDDIKPKNAHISRVVIEEDGEELEIVRHSLPYGDASGDMGLFFVAYTNDLNIINRMLARMHGKTEDGLHDRLLHFTKPVNGAYFFAPSQELLEQILEAD